MVYALTITQALMDRFRFLGVQARRASFDVDIVMMRNGCDVSVHCERTNLDAHETIPLALYDVGDVFYFAVSGDLAGDAGTGIFTFEVTGRE